jgi:hypothetical protein
MSVHERLALASTTANLGDSPLRVTDSDVLKASGAAGQRHALGIALIRLTHNHDMSQLAYCVAALAAELRQRRDTEDAIMVAARVLLHLCDDRCRACQGRRFEVIEGTPHLSDRECFACAGTGRVMLAGDDERWLVDQVARLEQAASAAIVEKLR